MNTVLCYLEKDDAYLMLHRTKKKNDLNGGKWIGVGGKFEAGESPEECLIREVKEETGIALTEWRYRGIITFDYDALCPTEYMHLFTAPTKEEPSVVCEEGDLAWIPKSELFSLPMWEGDPLFLRLLAQERPFFSLKLTYRNDRLCRAYLDGKSYPIS